MDCPKCMWQPLSETTQMDEFRESVNKKNNLNLGRGGVVFMASQ